MFFKKRRVKVKIDGKIYDSMSEGAEAMGWKLWNLADALRFGKSEYQGHAIERLDGKYDKLKLTKTIKSTNKSYRTSARSCPVICTTTGEVFRSITEAADHCNLSAWTMGLKMAKAGKFIDKEGNEYIRQKDANYSREYPSQTPTLDRQISKYTHKNKENIVQKQIVKSESSLNMSDENALRIITSNMVKNKQYNEASVLLNILKNMA